MITRRALLVAVALCLPLPVAAQTSGEPVTPAPLPVAPEEPVALPEGLEPDPEEPDPPVAPPEEPVVPDEVEANRAVTGPGPSDPAQPTPAPLEPDTEEVDRVLVGRIVAVLAGDTIDERTEALVLLGVVDDPRVLTALAYVARHDVRPVSAAAVRVMGTLGTPESVEALSGFARTARRPEVWRGAIEALGGVGTQAAGAALFSIADATKGVSSRVRRAARDELREHYPELMEKRGLPRVAGNRAIPSLAGAMFGGFTLYTVGLFAQSEAGPAIGAVGGALIGASTGFLLSQNLSTEQGTLYLSAGSWGGYAGITTAFMASAAPDDRLVFGLGVIGELIGLGAAYLVGDGLGWSTGDMFLVNLNGIAAASLAAGVLGLAGNANPRLGAGTTLAAAVVGLGVTGLVTKKLSYSAGDRWLSLLGTFEGGWIGGWSPRIGEADTVGSGLLVGATVGLLLTEVLGQYSEFTPGEVGQMFLVSGYAKVLGAGVGFLAEADSRAVIGTMLGVGAVGLLASGAFGSQLSYSAGDEVFVGVTTAVGLWHGIAIGGFLFEETFISGRQFGGLALTLTGAVGLGAMAISQKIEPSPWTVGMGSVGILWGTWFAAWGATLARMDLGIALLTTLVGTDLGLLATSLLVSPLVGLDPTILAGASIGAMATTGVATLIAALVTENSDALITTNLVASGVGLIGGGIVTHLLLDQAESDPGGESVGGSGGLAWMPVVGVAPVFGESGRFDGAVVLVTVLSP